MPDQHQSVPITPFHNIASEDNAEVNGATLENAYTVNGVVPEVIEETAPLSPEERQELGQLEEKIDFGLKAYHEAGLALQQILQKKLYREFHPSFYAYCEKRWGIARSRAYQLMEAAQVVDNLRKAAIREATEAIGMPSETIVEKPEEKLSTIRGQQNFTILPDNEWQARELTKLPPEKQPEVWARALETAPNGKMTAAFLKEVVKAEIEPDPEWESIREMRAEDPRLRYMNPHLVVGEKLKEVREDRDISQEELILRVNKQLMLVGAIQLPICQSAISVIENGKRSLSLLEALATAQVLGISVYEFSPWRDLQKKSMA